MWNRRSGVHATRSVDAARLARDWPADWATLVREHHRIDLRTELLGVALPHPIGKASGQLSLSPAQLEADAAAGLAFVVLKTVIGEDAGGTRTMGAWATTEARMVVERRAAADGRPGWTVTWTGRGWGGSLAGYAGLVEAGRRISGRGGPLVIPSVKLHLPGVHEAFAADEYGHTMRVLRSAWGVDDLLLEHDFSPTLAGDDRSSDRQAILRWVAELPDRIRAAAGGSCRVALKLMNAPYDDDFQRAMLAAAASADGVTVFNRLWDADRGVAYGGHDLSDRNLRVLATPGGPPRSGTGNILTGRDVVAYARRGCTTVQCHTVFQLPRSEYASPAPRSAAALHRLVFDERHGLVTAMLEAEREGVLARHGGELRFRDLADTPC